MLDDPGLKDALRGLSHSLGRNSSKNSRQTWTKKRNTAKSNTMVRKARNVF
jgi:uncharacterized protein